MHPGGHEAAAGGDHVSTGEPRCMQADRLRHAAAIHVPAVRDDIRSGRHPDAITHDDSQVTWHDSQPHTVKLLNLYLLISIYLYLFNLQFMTTHSESRYVFPINDLLVFVLCFIFLFA